MFHPPSESFLAHPSSLWTGAVKVRFLDCLAQRGNVRFACGHVGLSAETAYRQRRRDPVFARAWLAAVALARRENEQVLADRALDGVEEEVWYRGEMVGTRVRYDTRLLLAHLGRLDRLMEQHPRAEADAARFDELLAVIAEDEAPGVRAIVSLPPDRETFVREAAEQACEAVERAWEACEGEDGMLEDDAWEAYAAEFAETETRAATAAGAQWDEQLEHVHDAVDHALVGVPRTPAAAPPPPAEDSPAAASAQETDCAPWTSSTPSTPPATEDAAPPPGSAHTAPD